MSQRDVERTLGRLLTDPAFRRDFFRNPARACLELGVQLVAHEVDALLRVSPRRLASLAEQLDHRICRLDIEDVNDPSPPTIGEH
jgi:putative modified peptide